MNCTLLLLIAVTAAPEIQITVSFPTLAQATQASDNARLLFLSDSQDPPAKAVVTTAFCEQPAPAIPAG